MTDATPRGAQIPDSHRDLVAGPPVAALTTLMPDGSPQTSVVWCDSDATHVRVNCMRGFRKERNMRRDPRITLLCYDPRVPLRYLEVRGEVVEMTEVGAREHLDDLCSLYMGRRCRYFGDCISAEFEATETPILCRIRPIHAVARDWTRAGSTRIDGAAPTSPAAEVVSYPAPERRAAADADPVAAICRAAADADPVAAICRAAASAHPAADTHPVATRTAPPPSAPESTPAPDVQIPDSHRDLFSRPIIGVLTTLLPDGWPHSSLVWVDEEHDRALVNTTLERRKARNMVRDPRVSLLVVDPDDASRYVQVRGRAELLREGAVAHLDALARRYTDHPCYYGHVYPAEQAARETRVICRIRARRVTLDAIHR